MEDRNLRRPPIVNITGFKFRLNGKHRGEVLKLHLVGKVMPDLPQHFAVIAGRFGGAEVADIRKVRAAVGVYLLTVEGGQVVVGDFVVRVGYARQGQQPAFAVRHYGAKGTVHNRQPDIPDLRGIDKSHF